MKTHIRFQRITDKTLKQAFENPSDLEGTLRQVKKVRNWIDQVYYRDLDKEKLRGINLSILHFKMNLKHSWCYIGKEPPEIKLQLDLIAVLFEQAKELFGLCE